MLVGPEPTAADLRKDVTIPDDLRRRAGKIRIRIEIQVEADGSKNVRLLSPSGVPDLDQSVVQYFSRRRYEPARQNGQPVSSSLRRTLEISVED